MPWISRISFQDLFRLVIDDRSLTSFVNCADARLWPTAPIGGVSSPILPKVGAGFNPVLRESDAR